MKIGIVGYERNDMYGVHPDYLDFVGRFGSPIVLPKVSRIQDLLGLKIDGLVLPGGADVNPARYSRMPWIFARRFCSDPDYYLEYFDRNHLPEFIRHKFPIFGICRGLQTLNVLFGGDLHMDLPKHPFSKSKEQLSHGVLVNSVEGNFRSGLHKVNSFHHQGINRLGKGLVSMGRSSTDGLVEAIRHETLPIYAVQWHPERMDDFWSNSVMQKLFG